MNTYTTDQAKNSLLSSEQTTEATLYTVLTDIARQQFRTGPQRSGSRSPSERPTNLSGESRDSGAGIRTPGGASALGPVHGRGHHRNAHHRPEPDATCGGWLAIGLILGDLAAVALWLLDRRLKTAKRAQVALGYPVVAEIPFESSDSTEAYRMLWLSVFREPLPLPPGEQNERLYDGEDPVLDHGVGSRSVQAGRP